MARAMVVRLRYVLSPQRKPSATTGDGVPLALIFAHQHGAGFEAPGAICGALVAPGEAQLKSRSRLCSVDLRV